MEKEQTRIARIYRYVGADTLAFNAQKWATSALVTLEEEVVISNIFNRDFDTAFAEKGDVVNAHRLGTFTADRLEEDGTLTTEDPDATAVVVKLDQHITIAFPIKDRDNHRSFAELNSRYVEPAARGMIEMIDLICQGEKYQFYKNQHAVDGGLTYNSVVDTGKAMNDNNAPLVNRHMIGGPQFLADLQKTDKFTTNEMTGDGSPLINGSVGAGAGFSFGMSQMFKETKQADFATHTAVINLSAGYAKGATSLVVDAYSSSGGPKPGEFLTLNGFVYRIASDTITATTGTIVIESPGLYEAVLDDAVMTITNSGAVNYGAGYAAAYSDWIVVDGSAFTSTRFPVAGDGIAFGTAADVYGVIKADSSNNKFKLNRPLDAAIVDDDIVSIFPGGNYNFALVPGASTIVVRPMALPPAGAGVSAAIASDAGWSLRSMVSYNHTGSGSFKQTFSFDTLVGVKTTDTNMGALLVTR